MNPSILILGAGRSSAALINYLESWMKNGKGSLTVGDLLLSTAKSAVHNSTTAIEFDIGDRERSRKAVSDADVIISLLPAMFHSAVAELCLEEGKHLLTASYVSPEMKLLDQRARSKGLLFLNECGLDPGIDHMSVMQLVDRITNDGGRLRSLESFTGGLIAPETDPDNPWRYKFTWNPRNVVVAGQGTSKFLQDGARKYIPYQQLFRRLTGVSIPGNADYEGYANRDSLKYIDTYGLTDVHTLLRGTLRISGYCAAWDIFVQLGCTDDSYEMEGVPDMTHLDFLNSFLEEDEGKTVEAKLIRRFGLKKGGPELNKLTWSGFFEKEKNGLSKGTPAQVLEHILNKKWKLNPADKDLVVMWHRLIYENMGKRHEVQSSLVVTGDPGRTAMAKTVGLPLAIAARLLVEGKITQRGVAIPTSREIYEPVMNELGRLGIKMSESSLVR